MQVNFKDLFLGVAIGDAYGAGLEFQDRNWIREHVDFTEFVNKRMDIRSDKIELFTRDYKAWDYTDDAEMTIAVAKAMMSEQPFTEDLLVNFFSEEYNLTFLKRGYKRNGHGAMRWYFSGEKSIEEIKSFQKDKKYPGNAPPMRAIPLAFAPEDRIDLYAAINANCTHPHPLAVASSILVARAAQGFLLKDIQPEQLIAYCLQFINEPETIALLKKADQLPGPENLQEGDYEILCGPQPIREDQFLPGICGLPSNAMQTAVCVLYVLKHAKTSFEALKYSVNIGGDVDSLASICTGILAGKYGIGDIPEYMIHSVEGKEYVQEVGEEFGEFVWNKTGNE
ncbi:ADP-ribosylglycohydrolase family protein [Fluviicola sp.]|uniref:ADP-ribosylglycohydrolase family protein n=1 Tax=Fluviicola sp. TaxID=1917219 RepID=UPI0031D3F6AF